MEHEQTSSYARQGLILLVVCAVLICAAWYLRPQTPQPLPELDRYLPATTIVALSTDRTSVFDEPHPVVQQSERFRVWQEEVRTYWTDLEKRFGLRIEHLLFALSEDRGIEWNVILFSTNGDLSENEIAAAVQDANTSIGDFVMSDELRFVQVEPHVGALISPQDTQDYSSPSSATTRMLSDDPIAFMSRLAAFDQNPFVDEIVTALPKLSEELGAAGVGTFGAAIGKGDLYFRKYSDVLPDSSQAITVIPEQASFAVVGGLSDVLDSAVLTSDPFALALQNFVNDAARISSFDPKRLTDSMQSLDAFIESGDDWLMVGTEAEQVAELVSLFIGAESPKRSVSKLPDGTPYREILRGLPKPGIEHWNDMNLTIWNGASTTATTTDPTIAFQTLYTAEQSGHWYLSNSRDLLVSSLGSKETVNVSHHSLIRRCGQGLSGEIISMGVYQEASVGDTKLDLAYIVLKTAENREISTFCIF